MGKKKEEPLRVVFDTNVLVPALLFGGRLSWIIESWKGGSLMPCLTKETYEELRDVLYYPKFKLTEKEIGRVIKEDILPFFEVIEAAESVNGLCRDADDDKFISCAIAAGAAFLVTGDSALLDVEKYKPVRIIRATELFEILA
ncbi:MAG: putative toxin-antitoxin system toxin component, PIN family [Deltaproteobacteria bacterium]|nr:putative toxin-antitoxin system toxin component, PIN family [Deltaproteobacteria bacterium]